MRGRAALYLEEYARALTDEMVGMLEQQITDNDEDAGKRAQEIKSKIMDIRKIVSQITKGNLYQIEKPH